MLLTFQMQRQLLQRCHCYLQRNFCKYPYPLQSIRFIRHQTIHNVEIEDENEAGDASIETESMDDLIEDEDEFDEIQYKAYALNKEMNNNSLSDNTDFEVPFNNAVSLTVYPKPYDYGPDYRVSFPVNEIIEYLQRLGCVSIKVYDVHSGRGDLGFDGGYGVIEDKDWFILAVASNYKDLANVVKKLTRQGHDRRVHRDSYYDDVHSSYFSSEGEADWCLCDMADTLVLVCHAELLTDPLSMVNQIKDRFWRFLYGTYHRFQNKSIRYSV